MTFSNLWFQITIPGFVYLVALILLILSAGRCFGLHLDEDSISLLKRKETSAYFLYIGVATLFSSFVVGFTAQLVTQALISLWHPQTAIASVIGRLRSYVNLSDRTFYSYLTTRSDLLLFRHLWLSTDLLGGSLLWYLWPRQSKVLKWFWLDVCLIAALSFEIAYWIQRGVYEVVIG